jgi:tetratricopeptide (TPR) repeat protein
MRQSVLALVAVLLLPPTQDTVDPSLRAAVERFYATQEAEDVAAYLSLWASTAQRPQPDQLKYIFASGDDKFSDLTILRVRTDGDRTMVRVSVTRDRTSATARRPDGAAMTFHTAMNVALTFVREESEWKLVREGSPVDALADALISATPEERETLLAAEPELSGPSLVMGISRRADTLAQISAHSRAQTVYELALDLATRFGETKLQADMLQNIGNALYYQKSFAGALNAYEQSLARQRAASNDEGVANAFLGIATAHYSQFEYTDALVAYREALAIHERRDDTLSTATTLIGTGNIQFLEGDFAGAIVDYRRSRALFLKGFDKRGEARALEGLGRSFAAQGDYGAALDAFGGVLEEGRRRSDSSVQGTALANLGDVHVRLGNLDAARGLLDQSRKHFEAVRDMANVGHAWQAMALTDLMSGRFAVAEEEYARSSTPCTAGQDSECVARAVVGVAFAQYAQQHYGLAVASYRKAIAAFVALKKREDAARAELGLSQALTGNREYVPALASARHARDEAAAIASDDVVWRALAAEARALRRLSDSTGALAAAKNAVAQVERMAEASLDGGDRPAADSAGAYALLALLQAEAFDPTAAFLTVERGRVHTLRGVLARNEREIARDMTATEREDERRLAADVASLRAQLDHQKALPKPDVERVDRLKPRLASAVGNRTAQRQQIFGRLPDLRTWRGLVAPATIDEAAALLTAEGDVFANFVIDDEDLLVLLLVRGADKVECRAFASPVSRLALAERIARAVEPTALRSVEAWRLASVELMDAIPAGALAAIAAAPRVTIAPDDVLWRVPFEALPIEEGFLADRTTILYAGSATSLVRAPTVASSAAAASVVAIGAPELPSTIRDRVQATAPGWTLRATDAASAEIQIVAAAFDEPPPTILSATGATESALRAQAGGAAVLHVAAPFRMNGASPLFSPILLTPDIASPDPAADKDGVLETREVMNLELRARVTVLSDGSSTTMRGASPAADIVRWAWRAAGVPSIVLSRWATEDAASGAMLKELYVRLKAGDVPEVALQSARAAVRAREDTRAPYFWAGWMVVGR